MVAFVEPLADYDPRQVGGFRLQARLGAGGMGRVYLGYSPGGRPVAVKVVHPDLARDPEFMQRFRREVAAAQAVSDAYTAAVVGAGPDDSPPWLATTFVPGPSLADLVTRSGPLPEDAVWRLAGGLAEALEAIHAQGLIHRDLKPGNILVAADGPRVIDFGISRTTDGTVVTATRMTIGTPAYMSPEQAEGNPVGPPSDIFSLGSVLTFAATGSPPFGGGGEMFAVAYRVVNGQPDLSRVPVDLRPLAAACLAKNPVDRPSVRQLMRDVAVGAAAHPDVRPGRFWPDRVSALLESSAFTPDLPAPAPQTPVAGSPVAGSPVAGSPVAGSPVAQSPVAGSPAAQSATAPSSPAPRSTLAPGPALATEAAAFGGRWRGPRWLLPAALGVAVATGAGVAIALALSPSPKPPSFLGPSGAATASTAGSAAAVTVCTAPAGGCTASGSGQDMQARPRQIELTADRSATVSGLTWTGWGGQQATAKGTFQVSGGTGSAATVTVTGLSRFVGGGGGTSEAYSSITVKTPTKTFTFTENTVPS
jgi:serine/threonine protein kinase